MKADKKITLLTREETRIFLKISFPTLRKLTASGMLKAYALGGRIYYKRHEIIDALTPLN